MRGRKLRWLLALAGLAVLLSAGAFVLWPREDRITRANYDCIRVGMSRAEVEAILGPPGDWTTLRPGKPLPVGSLRTLLENAEPGATEWKANTASIRVWFNDAGTVARSTYAPAFGLAQCPLDNLLWRAKRQWRRWFP